MANVIEKRCKYCKNLFKTNNKQKMYCSDTCKKESRKTRHTYFKKCIVCGRNFKTFKRNSKCCSMVCTNKAKSSWDTSKTKHIYCKYCSKDMGTRNDVNKDRKFCSDECKIKERELHFKGSDPYGFVMGRVTSFGRRTRFHRAVMEKHLGRKLNKDEIVHHIDGNKFNNDLSNLMLLSNSEHAKLHNAKRNKDEFGRYT